MATATGAVARWILCANVAVHSLATTLLWLVLLADGDYVRVVVCLVATCVPRAFTLAMYARFWHTDGLDRARFAMALVTTGGVLVGAMLCAAATGVTITAAPVLLLLLSECDPMALMPIHFQAYEMFASGNGVALSDGGMAPTYSAVQTARTLGTLTGAFAFASAVVHGDVFWVPELLTGALLIAVQMPMVPIDAAFCTDGVYGRARVSGAADGDNDSDTDDLRAVEGPSPGVGCCALTFEVFSSASRIAAHITPRDFSTRYALSDMRMAPAVLVDLSAALSMSFAVSTWSYQALTLWTEVYRTPLTAWIVNVIGVAIVLVGAAVSHTDAIGLWWKRRERSRRRARHAGGADDSAVPVAGAALSAWSLGDTTETAASASSAPADAVLRPRRQARRRGMPIESARRLLTRVRVHAAVLVCVSIVGTAILDVSIHSETLLHVAVSIATLFSALQVDQLAIQTLVLTNAHAVGTRLDAFMFYALASVRAIMFPVGFFLAWYWRDRLHTTPYALAVLPVLYLQMRLRAHSALSGKLR